MFISIESPRSLDLHTFTFAQKLNDPVVSSQLLYSRLRSIQRIIAREYCDDDCERFLRQLRQINL